MEIVEIDNIPAKVTINHAAIPNLDMDSMTMVLKASDPAVGNVGLSINVLLRLIRTVERPKQ